MANLISVYNEAEKTYRIIDTDAGVEVVALDNKNIADNFVRAGVVSQESIMLAIRQDIATNGGPTSAPGSVQPFGSGGVANPNNFPGTSQINVEPAPANSVGYVSSQNLTPEQQTDLVQRLNAQGGGATIDYSKDPLYREFYENNSKLPPPPPLVRTPPEISDPPDPAAANAQAVVRPEDQIQNRFVYNEDGELVPADSPYALQSLREQEQDQDRISVARVATSPRPVGGRYTEIYNPETGKYDVYNLDNPDVPVRTGLILEQAQQSAQDLASGGTGYTQLKNFGIAYDDDGFLNPGYTLNEDGEPVFVGTDFVEPSTAASAEASRIQALAQQAQQQATVSAQRKAAGKAAGDGDWRVRLRLAPNATYLYKTPGIGSAGIMEPLRQTDGVVFPYTPKIDITYSAEYNPYDLVHSNYRGYFYKGSRVGEVVMNADFTAQDSSEADYLLAVIHFFRSATKMFYGQDKQRGTPPPLVFLSGLGEFQFNEHPCVISQFNYSLPSDVDYIRARGRQSTSSGVTQGGDGLMFRRTLSSSTAPSYSLSSIWSRLTGANLPQGGMNIPPAPPNLGLNSPTYVPTKISMSLTLLPMPTRSQVSQQFSLEKFANGNLLRGGFW